MDHTYVDEKSLKSLEDLAVHLTAGMYTLMTMNNFQVRSIEIGIMKEDMNERSNTMIWDIRRLIKHYQTQLENVLELLPPEFNANETIKKMQAAQLKKARALTRKPRSKKAKEQDEIAARI